KLEEATAEQSKVLGNLAEIAEQLQNAAGLDQADKSAEEFAELVRNLEQVREELKPALKKQEQAAEKAAEKPAEAKAAEEEAATTVEKITAAERELPQAVKSRLEEA